MLTTVGAGNPPATVVAYTRLEPAAALVGAPGMPPKGDTGKMTALGPKYILVHTPVFASTGSAAYGGVPPGVRVGRRGEATAADRGGYFALFFPLPATAAGVPLGAPVRVVVRIEVAAAGGVGRPIGLSGNTPPTVEYNLCADAAVAVIPPSAWRGNAAYGGLLLAA
jgi:hypothetical protein